MDSGLIQEQADEEEWQELGLTEARAGHVVNERAWRDVDVPTLGDDVHPPASDQPDVPAWQSRTENESLDLDISNFAGRSVSASSLNFDSVSIDSGFMHYDVSSMSAYSADSDSELRDPNFEHLFATIRRNPTASSVENVEFVVGPTELAVAPNKLSNLWLEGPDAGMRQPVKSSSGCVYLSDVQRLDLRTCMNENLPVSFGTLNHLCGKQSHCKPCVFQRRRQKCKKGWLCDLCHLHLGVERPPKQST